MTQTTPAVQVPQAWTKLTDLAPIALGESVILQNIGRPADIVSIALSVAQPADDFAGVAINQITPKYRVQSPKFPIWVRYYRFDNLEKYPARTCSLQVQRADDDAIRDDLAYEAGLGTNEVVKSLSGVERAVYALLCEFKLLNARFEDAYETGVQERDI